MWKKLIILAGVVGIAAVVAKKVKAMNEERALWHEATTSAEDVRLASAKARIQFANRVVSGSRATDAIPVISSNTGSGS